MTLRAEWFDLERDPKNPADPNYPDGVDIDVSNGASTTCSIELQHPTKRCGQWLIICDMCGLKTIVTTAGRVDDPRSFKAACIVMGAS